MSAVIIVENLHKRYKDKYAVQGVDLQIEQGEIFGILGPNGAGKTTTMEIIEGIRQPDKGKIRVLGLDPKKNKTELSHRIGIQFQSTSLPYKMKVSEALTLFGSMYEKKRETAPLVESLGLTPYLDKYFENLSGGWKQRVTLAIAILHDPDILFLDEPSTGLDPKARRDLWQVIFGLKKEGKTIVLTTHYMEEAQHLCDRVAMFYHGRVIGIDTPKGLIEKLGPGKYILFESPDANMDILREIPNIQDVTQTHQQFKLYGRSLQNLSLSLFQLAAEHQWTIEEFAFETGSLEELFVHLSEGGEFIESHFTY